MPDAWAGFSNRGGYCKEEPLSPAKKPREQKTGQVDRWLYSSSPNPFPENGKGKD